MNTTEDTSTAAVGGSAFSDGLGAWLPIATAPRDGKRVLVWVADARPARHAFARLWFHSTDGSLGGGAEGFNGSNWRITHWMHLPAPPLSA